MMKKEERIKEILTKILLETGDDKETLISLINLLNNKLNDKN